MSFRWSGSCRLLLALLIFMGGACSSAPQEDRKPVFPTRGQVFVGGQPAESAFVLFTPVNEPAEAKDPRPRAEVEKDGSFALSTYGDKDGAPAGEYIVTVTWPDKEEQADRLLGRYSDAARSALRATVKEGSNELPPFQLP